MKRNIIIIISSIIFSCSNESKPKSNSLESYLVNNFNYDPDETISIIIEKLKFELLNPVEEMLVLEIVLRLVYADAKIDEKEIEFIKSVRSCLSLDDEMITQRFGAIDFLINAEIINISSQEKSTKKMNSIDMTSLENMYSKLDGKE